MNGTIGGIENHGSIVILRLDIEDGRNEMVFFDHRAFGWMIEGEGIESADELLGRSVSFDGHVVEFLDSMEAI